MEEFKKNLNFDYRNLVDSDLKSNEQLKKEFFLYLVFSFLEPIKLNQITEIISNKNSIENQIQLEMIKDNINNTIEYYDFYVRNNPDFLVFAATVIRDEFTMLESDSSIKKLFIKRCKDLENEFEVYIYQKAYIDRNLEDLNQRYNTEIKKLNELQQSIASTEKEVNDIKKNTYTDLIAILGIFSALVFGFFGGLETASSLVDLLVENHNISYILMAISILVLFLAFFTLLLFVLLGHIINKPIFTNNNIIYKNIIKKFGIFCLLSFLIGLTIEIGNSTGINKLIFNLKNGVPLYIGLCVIIIVLLWLLLKKNKNE